MSDTKNYLLNGGLFNPEMMNHDEVRNLVMQLEAELAVARKDTERLDWLFRMGATSHRRLVNGQWIHWLSVDGQGTGFDYINPRDAIDNAMKESE